MPPPTVTAIVLAHRRPDELAVVLEKLAELPVLETIVATSGDPEVIAAAGTHGRDVRVVDPGGDVGIAGRNLAAEHARGDLLLHLDDDSYPLPGTIERMRERFALDPRLGALAGFVRDVTPAGEVTQTTEVGGFDWFLRVGARGPAPEEGFPTFFFPEGGVLIRRTAYLEVGGFFAPYFFTVSEVDLSTRLIGAGWDVRYLPDAPFDHRKAPAGRHGMDRVLRLRVRNQLWYFWMRFPAGLAARRIPAYLAFDLVECAYRGAVRAWVGGIADAWRERDRIRGQRAPLPRSAIRRAELGRGRMHLRLLAAQTARRLRPGTR